MAKNKTNPELDILMSETVVVRAVDDGEGVILAATNDVKGPYESDVPFEHWAQGDGYLKAPSISGSRSLTETASELKAKLQDVSHVVKDKIQDLSHEAKDKAIQAKDEVKKSVAIADAKVKQNPYLYAIGAVGVGFVLGRLLMAAKAKSQSSRLDVSDFKDSSAHHTGVHIRRESRFASR